MDASESLQAAGMLLHCQAIAGCAEEKSADAKRDCRWARGRSEVPCVCFQLRSPKPSFPAWAPLCGVILVVHESAPLWGLWLHPWGSPLHQAVDVPLVSLRSSVKWCWRSFFAKEMGTKMGIRAGNTLITW